MFTYWGVILNFAAYFLPFGVFVFSGFLRTISRELDGRARSTVPRASRSSGRIISPAHCVPRRRVSVIVTALWTLERLPRPTHIPGRGEPGVTITTGIYLAIGTYSVNYGQEFGVMFLASLRSRVLPAPPASLRERADRRREQGIDDPRPIRRGACGTGDFEGVTKDFDGGVRAVDELSLSIGERRVHGARRTVRCGKTNRPCG